MKNKTTLSLSQKLFSYIRVIVAIALGVVLTLTALYLPSHLSTSKRYTYASVAIHQSRVCYQLKADIEMKLDGDIYRLTVNGTKYPSLRVVDVFGDGNYGVVDPDGVYRTLTQREDELVLEGPDMSMLFSNDSTMTLKVCTKKRN